MTCVSVFSLHFSADQVSFVMFSVVAVVTAFKIVVVRVQGITVVIALLLIEITVVVIA